MISWSIQVAVRSNCFDRIIVSTDDKEIAELARSCGAEVPFIRSAELSDDHTTSLAVIADVVLRLAEVGEAPEAICCLYATAPFIRPEDIRAALDILERDSVSFVFPVTTFDFPIDRALMREPDGGVQMRHPEHLLTRSQDLPEYFHDAGQFYWGTYLAWKEGEPVYSSRSRTILLPRYRVQDIDSMEDWKRAELIFESLTRSEKSLWSRWDE